MAIKKKKKNYNEILYELQKEAVLNKTGATDDQLKKQAAKQDFSQEKRYAPITKNKVVSNTYAKTSSKKATTTTKKKDDNRTWFKSGAFSDGYDFGDITKTILGTTTELYQDAVQGAIGIGEKAIDAGAYFVGLGADKLGADDLAEDTKSFIMKDLIDEEKISNRMTNTGSVLGWANNIINGDWDNFNPLNADGTAIEENSLFGDKADSLIQSGGQLAATFGLQAAGVPWWLTTGVTSFGAETEQAFNEGATYGEAGLSGLITGGAEILTEKLSGGIKFGGKTLDDVLLKPLTEKISNKVLQGVTKAGIDIVGEGTEEVLSDLFSNVGKKLTYEDEKTWGDILTSEEAMDNYLDSFIGGAVLGGVGSVTQQIQSNKPVTENNIQQDETELRRTNFTYDTTKITDEVEKSVYDSATKYFNNTARSHEFVERVARISKDKGTRYSFINNEELQSNGLNVEGKQVNGLVRTEQDGKPTILINIDSPKALNTIVGHETTHLLEGTQEYQELQQSIFEYAKTKGDLDTVRNNLKELYKDIENADIDSELTAELVGDYLFTDSKFIDSLAVEKPTLFQKIKELIDDLVVRFTGTKEERQLRQVQKAFKNAYSVSNSNNIDTKYSTSEGKIQGLENYTRDEIKTIVSDYINTELEYSFGGEYEIAGIEIIGSRNRGNARTDSDLDVVVEFEGEHLREDSLFNALNEERLNIDGIEVDINPILAYETGTLADYMEDSKAYDQEVLSKQSIKDNQGRTLTKEQQEYFKDSKVRDENGNLKVLYHGSTNEFTVFDINRSGDVDGRPGLGFWFTESKEGAKQWSEELWFGDTPTTYEVYLNIKNPKVYETNSEVDGYRQFLNDVAKYNDNLPSKQYKNELIAQGYDGIVIKNTTVDSKEFEGINTQYVAFEPNQIKNIDNTNPTSDADIRYSLSEKGTLQDNNGNEIKLETTNAGTTGTLLAVHSVNEKNLKNILSLGGIPVGSLAITNADKIDVLSEFGGKDDFILMFNSDTIDPKNKLNEVYNRDVYSKTVPQIYQKVDKRALKKVIDEFGPYESEYGSLNKHDYSKSSLESIVDDLSYSSAVKAKFLEDNGYGIKKIYKDFRSGYYSFTAEEIENFKKKYPDLAALNEYSVDTSIADQIREITLDMMAESDPQVPRETFAKLFKEKFYLNDVIKFYRDIKQYDNANKGQEFDSYATRDNIDKAVKEHEEEFNQWLTGKFENLYGDKYFENESGTRKYDYTLENLTSYMKKGNTKAQQKGMFNSFSIGQAKAGAAKSYKTLDQIREASKDLVDAETYKARHEAFEEIDDPVRTELGDTRISKGEDLFEVYSDYYMALSKAASGVNPTRALENNYFKDLTPEQINKFSEVAKELANLPAKYFEAKPQRAISLNEIDTIAIPNTASESIKQQLINNGFNIVEYDPTIEGDKQRIVEEQDRLKFSLSQQGQDIAPTGDYNVYGDEVKLQVEEAIAPLQEKIETLTERLDTVVNATEQQEIAPVEQVSTQPTKAELDNLMVLQETGGTEYANEFFRLRDKYGQPKLYKGINEYKKSPSNYGMIEEGNLLTEADLDEFYNQSSEVFKTITDEDAPMPMEDTTPDYDYEMAEVESPLKDRNIEEVGNRKVKAYQYEHPEVRPYFQEAALGMLYDLNNTTKGERIYNDEVYYNTNGEEGWMGIKRQTTDDIADLLDNFHDSYADIEKGLRAIIEDNGAENIAVAKRIEFALDDRLRNGYTAVDGLKMPANQEYIDLLRGKEFTDYYNSIPDEDIAPIETNLEENSVIAPETKNVAEKVLKTSNEEIVTKPETTKEKPKEVKKSTNPIKPKTKGSTRDTLNYLFINRNEAIDRFAKETGNNNIKFLADHVNNVSGEISTNINKAQIDNNGSVIGKSIVDIFNQAREAKLTAAFDDYLFHLSNKARHKQGKGSLVPLTESKALIIEYEKAYPEMKKWAREVNKYNKNNLYKQVEADLYSKEFADGLVEKYEFYVPFFADVLKTYVPSKTKGIQTRGTVRLAEGGANRNLLSFEEAMIRQTQMAITAIRKNQLYQEIVDSSPQVALGTDADANGLYADENGYYVTAKVNGENVSAYISEDLYKGLENRLGQDIRNIEQKLSGITKPLQAIGNIRRNILTTWSPSFIITNPAKDIQDAPLNSKYAKDWAINYPIAFKELTLGKGEHLQEFLNMYGEAGIMGDYVIDSGVSDATKIAKTKKKLAGISRLNEMLELAPRYAEYLASLKNGTSQMEALYNAREVTTNFGRGGVITKALNRNGFTFLNASVQGFNKLYRNFSGENGAKGVVNASLKAVMLGVVPALFNALSYDDDEDYEALPDYIKDNYYLYKTDDGEFIRIPKGRMMSIFGSAARRALEATQGEENAFEGYLTNAYSQVGIQNPLESNILAPILQAYGSKNGKTWYGTDLVPTRLQDVPKGEQYDESTDKFSIWLGQTFGISPYKVNYIFDQYSGGIGDLLLPTITEEANSDGSFLAPLKDKFTANSTMDNKYASEFYTKRDKLQVNANSMYSTEEDTLMSMYMDEVSWDMSALYKEKREVQNSDLSKAEKYEKVQEIQQQINDLAKEALNTYDTGTYTENYASIGNYEFYKGTDYNGNEEWKTVYDYKVDDLAELGMTSDEKNEYFALKQEFDALNNEYYDTKDNLESTYGKHSDEFEDESDELYMEKKNTIIDTIMASGLTDDAKAYLYKEYYNSSDIDTITMSGIAVDYFLDYQKNDFKADYNSKGKAIPNSRKNKVIDYVNEFDLSVPEKAIIIKSTNTFKFNDYNDEIVSYVADLDISEEDKIYILYELGMTVDDEGYAHWE